MARNRMTLLRIVQTTLDALGSTPVNSISDSIEATQIAEEARITYYDLMDRDEWPHLIKTQQLESLADTTKPNYLRIPESVTRIDDVRYDVTSDTDTSKRIDLITYLSNHEFLDLVYRRNLSDANTIEVEDFSGVKMFIVNNQRPQYWTTFDDEHIVFDSYDSAVDSTLQASKSIVKAKVVPTWTTTDLFVPDLPDQMFSTFLAEVRAAASIYLRRETSLKDEQRAARGIAKLRRQAAKVRNEDGRANYGRKRFRSYGSKDGHRGSIEAARLP